MRNSCRIVKVGAVTAIFNEDGTRNELFQQALEYYDGNVEQAMDVWNIFNSEEFETTGLKIPTVEQVISFASNFTQTFEETKTLSGREVVEVLEMAENTGFSSLNEFRDKLNSIFKPKGFFEMNTKEAVKSGLYTAEEVEAINPNTLFNSINRLDKHIDAYGDIEITSPKYSGVKNTSRPKNMFGSYPSVTEAEVVQYVLDNGVDSLVDSEYSFVSQNISDGILGTTRAKNQENAKPKFTLTPQDTLDRLNKTGLANKVHILSPKQMDDKLVELGVDTKLAKQVIGRKGAKELDDYSMGVVNRLGDLTIAEQMERNGKSPIEIKLATGWERGGEFISIFEKRTEEEVVVYLESLGVNEPNLQEIKNNELTFQKQNGIYNGKWRYEISDGKLKNMDKIIPNKHIEWLKSDVFGNMLGNIYINGELYKAYPELKNTRVVFYKPTENSYYSDMLGFENDGIIFINYDKGFGGVDARTELGGNESTLRVLVHELQHIIQRIEGFGGGTNPKATRESAEIVLGKITARESLTENEEFIKDLIRSENGGSLLNVSDEVKNKVAIRLYARSIGEVEARNVEKRLNKKNGLLRSTGDVIRKMQLDIVRFQTQGLNITPNGFVYNGEVFLNEDKINDTSLLAHEFNHLYTNLLKQTNRPLYDRGLKLIEQEGQEYINFVKQSQPNLEGEALLEEALTQAVGEQGARIVDEARRNKFVQFLADLWSSIKGQLGLSAYSNSQVQKMNLKEYINAVAVDLLSGEKLIPKTEVVSDLSGNLYNISANEITRYSTEVGNVSYIIDKNGEMVMLKETKPNDDNVLYAVIPNGRGISHTFNLGGKNIASIRTLPIENGEVIEGVIVKEDYQGQGIGTELYLETIRNLMIDKKVLRSDKAQTIYAKRIWDNLVNLGLAVKINDSQYESIPTPFNVTSTTSIDTVINFLSQPPTEMYVFDDVTKDISNRAESDKFGINIEEEASSYRQVPTLMLDGEVFTTENIYPYIELKNTIIPSNSTTFNVDANLLLNLDEDVWLSRRKEVKSVLKGIEKTLISNNIDVIGISELETSREVVSEFLVAIRNVLSLPNDTNIRTLANLKSEYLNSDMKVFTKDLPSKYDNLTVVSVESNLSQDELFEMEGLIKVHTDNLYQKVEVLPIDELYDEMYSRFLRGEVNIPQNFFPIDMDVYDVANEAQVLEGIQNYVRSRDVGFDSLHQEAISAYQLLFNHDPIPQRLPNIESLKTNAEYLKTGFVTDFYNFILQEKFNNTDLYNSTLKYFKVTDSDLSFHGIDLNIGGMKYEQELIDYAQVKKDSGKLGELVENIESEYNEDLEVINNPESVTNTPNYTQIDRGLYVTNQSPENYIRLNGGGVARMVGQMFGNTVYQDVNIIRGSNIYYDTNLNFDVNTDVISKKYLAWKQANNVGLSQVNDAQVLDDIKTPNNITETTLQQANDFGITINPTSKSVREKYDECGV